MKIGDLVKYKPNQQRDPKDIGIIIGQASSGSKFLVVWINGTRQWRYTHILEVISESR